MQLGAYALRFVGGKLVLEPGCPVPNPSCFTRTATAIPAWQQDAVLLDFSNTLVQAIREGTQRAKPYPRPLRSRSWCVCGSTPTAPTRQPRAAGGHSGQVNSEETDSPR